MRLKPLAALAAAGGVLAAAGSAGAATFTYSTDFSGGVGAEWAISSPVNSGDAGILGQLGGGGASSATLSQTSVGASAANAGSLVFDLLGFRTVDGFNCCTDTFSLAINGLTVFQGVFAMGGGGGEGIAVNLNGATVTGSGSVRTITVPFTVALGANSFNFSYAPLQSFDDEAFGLDNVSISAVVADPPVGGGVPEPGTWALMILGFGAAGTALRARRRLPAA